LVGLGFVNGIISNVAQFNHIVQRHSSGAAYPQSPRNGRFAPSILSPSTPKTQFDVEMASPFNEATPIDWGYTTAGIEMEFVLIAEVGLDLNNMPTNSVTVVLSPVGSGTFEIWTAYPGHLATDN
jgi:hypothetical protein